MNHFHYGFATELVDIMEKEAARKKEPPPPTRGERFKAGVDPNVTMGEAVGSGMGVQLGGELGSAMARRMGVRGSKGQLAASVLGSALGLRHMHKRHKSAAKEREEEELRRMLKKEGQQRLALATQPRRDATSGATPSPRPTAPASKPATPQVTYDSKLQARGTPAQLAEERAARGRAATRELVGKGVKAGIGHIKGMFTGGGATKAPASRPAAPAPTPRPTPKPIQAQPKQRMSTAIKDTLQGVGSSRSRYRQFM